MKGIQVIGILIGVYQLVQVYIYYKRNRFRVRRSLFLAFIWSTIIILFYNPSLAAFMLPIFSMQDLMLSVVVTGVLISLVLISRIWQNIAKLEKNITELSQNYVLHNYLKDLEKENIIKINDDEVIDG